MKRIYKYSLLLVLVFTAGSCSDSDLLDKLPYNNIEGDMVFDTPQNIRFSVNGMYHIAAIGSRGGLRRGYVWGAAHIQQNDNRGEDVVNTASFYQITYLSSYDTASTNNVSYWTDGYSLINAANIVIEGVTKAATNAIISQAEANNILGQARFLRAITHFELLIHMARPYNHTANASHLGVIYRDFAINSNESFDQAILKGSRSSVADIYKYVLEDLDFAESNITNTSLIYASRNAAIAFKTRVYLHMRNWDKVIEEASKIEDIYVLTSTPSGVFNTNLGNTESIFSINQTSTSNAGVNGALGSQYGRRILVAISPIIWNNSGWLADDLRRKYGEETDLVRQVEGTLYTYKYKDFSSYTDLSPVLRHAEVKLNLAEAFARKGDLQAALVRLNQVRDRALANPETQSYTLSSLPTNKAMVEAIILERRIEFLMEGKRWGDIHRLQKDDLAPITGIPAKVANGVPRPDTYRAASGIMPTLGVTPISYEDYRFIWPIPHTEMSGNPQVKDQQNPGY